MIRTVHVYTTLNPGLIEKQFPKSIPELDGIRFTIGLKIDKAAEVLIVHRFGEQIIPTALPKHRIGFICGEPEDTHPFSPAFLEQFGAVWGPENYKLCVPYFRINYACLWYAGIDFSVAPRFPILKGHTYFEELSVPSKDDRISVVATMKSRTAMHLKRHAFLHELRKRLGDRLVIYGENHHFVKDKAEALLPHKYHVALENTERDFCWTEKLSDPLLCWSLPFYAGVPAETINLPKAAFIPVDIDNPETAARIIEAAVLSGAWEKSVAAISEARNTLLHSENLAYLLVRAAKHLLAQADTMPTETTNLVIKSESMYREPRTPRLRKRLCRARFLYRYFPQGQILFLRLKMSPLVLAATGPFKQLRHFFRRTIGRRRMKDLH